MPTLAVALLSFAFAQASPIEGTWRAWLDSPGGELPFGLEIQQQDDRFQAFLINGSERIDVPITRFESGVLELHMPHYDSRISAKLEGDELYGSWRKRRKVDNWTTMSFYASRGDLPRFHQVDAMPSAEVDGRWKVEFESSEDPAVGIFKTDDQGRLEGTFLTSTGDYRFLAGDFVGNELRLSCFDGAHAFLFDARLTPDGSLAGSFWSRDTWHETWRATRDESASLPDAFKQTTWDEEISLAEVIFPDLDGKPRSLADPEFAGKARVIQVFGSWCPNCNDEGRYLSELVQSYGEKGLSILGLAFELTGEHERDAKQVRRYLARNDVNYPVLIAGTADKTGATRAFPALDFVRSYPTTIFLRQDGTVRAVHTGFTGPATGDAFVQLREEFEGLIDELLEEPAEDLAAKQKLLSDHEFRQDDGSPLPSTITFSQSNGALQASAVMMPNLNSHSSANSQISMRASDVHLTGRSMVFGDEVLRVDYELKILYDPRRFERRFMPSKQIDAFAKIPEGTWFAATSDSSANMRSEAIVQFSKQRKAKGKHATESIEGWLEDPALRVELAAIWSIGFLEEESLRDHLIERLSDSNAAVRRESILSLARLKPSADVKSRVNELKTDPDIYVREAVAEAQAQ